MKSNKSKPFQDILNQSLERRSLLKNSALACSSLFFTACATQNQEQQMSKLSNPNANKNHSPRLSFKELEQGLDKTLSVAEGYEAQVLVRWGDPIFAGAPSFAPEAQTEAKQLQQFGFNNDFIGYLPLPLGSQNSTKGLLVVNHEYTSSSAMHPGSPSDSQLNFEQTAIDIAAHGLSIIEISKSSSTEWQLGLKSKFNKRITPNTPMQFTGPAAGHPRMKTSLSTDGISTLGTYGNCAGGVTPWGTVLTGEENIDKFFAGDFSQAQEQPNLERFGMNTKAAKSWAQHHPRWNLEQNPGEALHMGWIVEIDPYESKALPKKRSALGRFKHEGCNLFINADKSVVAYMGDDEKFEYLYKFVSHKKYQPENRQHNMSLLDEGELYCAQFSDNGTVEWLSLAYGKGPLNEANGFYSQADVCIDTRKAADLVGATPMDRPEDVEVNPVTGSVFVMLTKNQARSPAQVDGPNPRANNRAGQIIELIPPHGDHCAKQFQWQVFLLAGPLTDSNSSYHPSTSANGWLACPDNCAFDQQGNLWIATDGAPDFGVADGIWACEVEGPNKALTKRFLRTPLGAELCGPFFTPDDQNLFCSVQHPGSGSSYEQPSTRWPDFNPKLPPRPSVVVVSKKGGGRVGS